MTRDEHRKACIEAMEEAFCEVEPSTIHEGLTAAFDSLHGIARVVPIGAEMKLLPRSDGDFDIDTRSADLTNPPEEKL